MKSTEELNILYKSKLKPALQAIEWKRKIILTKYFIFITSVLTSFAAAFFLAETYIIVFYLAIAVILGLGEYLFFAFRKQQKTYRAIFKQNIVEEIDNLINPNWRYNSDGKISTSDYNRSQLFNTRIWTKI